VPGLALRNIELLFSFPGHVVPLALIVELAAWGFLHQLEENILLRSLLINLNLINFVLNLSQLKRIGGSRTLVVICTC
jgi:hypothetical protein